MATIQKIVPNLWFVSNAEEAVKYYTSIFKNSKVGRIARYGNEGQDITKKKPGEVLTIEFEIEGTPFVALNGSQENFTFNESISFIVNCKDQKEIDYYWDKLTPGGDPKAQVCGWLKDKFGVSWQINSTELSDMVVDKDVEKVDRVMQAMFKMKKLDIAVLKKAYNGEAVPA